MSHSANEISNRELVEPVEALVAAFNPKVSDRPRLLERLAHHRRPVPTSIASESKLASNSSENGQHGGMEGPHDWARRDIDGHVESRNGSTVAVLPASAHATLHFAEHRLPTGGKIGVTDGPKGVRKLVESNQPLDRISSIDAGGKGGRSLGLCVHVTHHGKGV